MSRSSAEAGFTLIELMVVIAIIALLALFGVPQYANHTQRAKVTGALSGIAAVKLAVATCAQESGSLSGCSSGTADIPAAVAGGSAGSSIQYVDAVSVTDGVISLVSTGKLSDGSLMGLTLTPLLSDSALRWALSGTGCASASNARGIRCTAQ